MRLGPIMRGWMKHEEKSLRGLGKEMGVDKATLWRFMEGKNPDGETLAKVIQFCLRPADTEKEGEGR